MKKIKMNNSTKIILIICLAIIAGGVSYISYNRNNSSIDNPFIEVDGMLPNVSIIDDQEVDKLLEASSIIFNEDVSVVDVVQKATPSVVGIRVSLAGSGISIFETITQIDAEGSGIIISEDGYIITNYHVVSMADPTFPFSSNMLIEVFLIDGREKEAVFIGGDKRNDIAVIKIDSDRLPVAEIGDSSVLMAGQKVIAIGNPMGLEFAGSITQGIISALNRSMLIGDSYLELIQTDAAINPGNSGGALINMKGQIIGINTVKMVMQGVEGLGFAIPMNDAWDIAKQLIEYGEVVNRASFGIRGTMLTKAMAAVFNTRTGFFVLDVTNGGSAQTAGIKKGDIIVLVNDSPVESIEDIYKIEKAHKPGDKIMVGVVRDRKEYKVQILLKNNK